MAMVRHWRDSGLVGVVSNVYLAMVVKTVGA